MPIQSKYGIHVCRVALGCPGLPKDLLKLLTYDIDILVSIALISEEYLLCLFNRILGFILSPDINLVIELFYVLN